MKVTVCQLRNDSKELEKDWESLVEHVKQEASELVLLPEMPFYPWVAATRNFSSQIWQHSVEAHNKWMFRLQELTPAIVVSTRPVLENNKRLNEGFIWEEKAGYNGFHTKSYLPNEEKFWEATWYNRGDFTFKMIEINKIKIGMMICTEMWFTEHARAFAKEGIHILFCPRASAIASVDKWLAGGRAASVMSGAFCLSSNRGGTDQAGTKWAGTGWIIEPKEGEILGTTSVDKPFLTLDIDLSVAEKAKKTYPRYVIEK